MATKTNHATTQLVCSKCEKHIFIDTSKVKYDNSMVDADTNKKVNADYSTCPECHTGHLQPVGENQNRKPTHEFYCPAERWENSVQRRAMAEGTWFPIRKIS